MKLRIVLLVLLFRGLSADQQCMFIFMDNPVMKTDDIDVGHQCITALMQKAGPVLVSKTLWAKIAERRVNFEKNRVTKGTIQYSLWNLYKFTNKKIQELGGNISKINQQLSDGWYQRNFPRLARFSKEEYKDKSFSLYCYLFTIGDSFWDVYSLSEGYMLFIPKNRAGCFNGSKLSEKISHAKIWQQDKSLKKQEPLHQVLKRYIPYKGSCEWIFYITGHGQRKDQKGKDRSMIVAMDAVDFQKLLIALDDYIRTKLLVYSTCYGGGLHLVDPYRLGAHQMKLQYSVISTAITDAPIYTFGIPAGVKLPPYNSKNMLRAGDCTNRGLHLFFTQDFNQFCELADQNRLTKEFIRTISRYFYCNASWCKTFRIENMPMIRKAGSVKFMPLDRSMICIGEDSGHKSVAVDNKSGILLYDPHVPQQFTFKNELCPIISMLPGHQIHHIQKIVAPRHSLMNIIQQSLLGIDDLETQLVMLIDQLETTIDLPKDSKKSGTCKVLLFSFGKLIPLMGNKRSDAYAAVWHNDGVHLLHFDDKRICTQSRRLQKDDQRSIEQLRDLVKQSCKNNQEEQNAFGSKQHNNYDTLITQCLEQGVCKIVT